MSKKKEKKPRRRGVRLWGILVGVFAVLFVGLIVAYNIAGGYATAINTFLSASTSEVRKGDDQGVDTQYYTSAFSSEADRQAQDERIAEQVEGEGATLLFNNGNALPLAKGSNVSAVSHSSVDPVYGGTGSGQVDASTAPTLKSSLTDAGFNVNGTLWDYYASDGVKSQYSRVIPQGVVGARNDTSSTVYDPNEVPWDEVMANAGDSFSQYGDAALFIISRSGGEAADLPDGEQIPDDAGSAIPGGTWVYTSSPQGDYLTLSETERENLAGLKQLKDQGVIKKIIVLVNSSNALNCDYLNPQVGGVDYGIDAALWIGDPGQMGLNAVAKILSGDINPSGSLVDTFVYDNHTAPASVNFLPMKYTNSQEAGLSGVQDIYNVYQEGIYVGYRYYETRYEDYVTGSGNAGDYDYGTTVAYPFGTNSSYATFAYSDFSSEDAGDRVNVTVTVTNNGSVAGKKAVQVYGQQPYTAYDRENGVEKSAVQLVGFDKTKVLEPGESQTVTISVAKGDLASYDATGAKTYIMDAGDYYLTVADDAHEATNNFLAAKGFSPANTAGRMDAQGSTALVGSFNVAELDTTTYSTSSTGVQVTNQFDSADPNKAEATPGSVTYLSRSDWTGTWPQRPEWTATDAMVAALQDSRHAEPSAEGTMPTTGATGNLTLAQMIGKPYNDPMWDQLLDQLTFDEMSELITLGGHTTKELASVSKPATRDENGPQGVTARLMGGSSKMAFTSEDVMAATFNRELMHQMGQCIGEDALAAHFSGLYGPALNTHRVAWGGRNFEYYSEDPFIAGSISAEECKGIREKGVYVFLKHFAVNEVETGRGGICNWLNEQSMREIYLKPFQIAVEGNVTPEEAAKGPGVGVMNSFTRIGCTWTGASKAMQTTVLRDEWGATGINITDFSGFSTYMDVTDGLLAGTELWDSTVDTIHTAKLSKFRDDPTVTTSMREASHRILFNVANSNAMNGYAPNDHIVSIMPWWQKALITVIVVLGALTACSALMTRRAIKRNEPAKARARKA